MIAGVGKKEDITKDTIRYVSGKIAQKARELKLKEFSIIVPPTFVIDQISSHHRLLKELRWHYTNLINSRQKKKKILQI